MNILITGGAGFLGTHLALSLHARGDRVIVFENEASVYAWGLKALEEKATVVYGDILDQSQLEEILRSRNIDKVIHAAAIVGARQALGVEKKVAEINIMGTLNLLEAIRSVGGIRCINITSEEVYGNFICDPADETHPPGPLSPYGISKYAAEAFIGYYRNYHGMDLASVRTSWVFGAGLPRERIPMNFIKSALTNAEIHSDSGAEMRIDYVFIDDFVNGTLLALDASELKSDVYHIASGQAYSVLEVAEMIAALVPGVEVSIGPGLLRTPEGLLMPQKGGLDISRAEQELGYRPQVSLDNGLRFYIEYLRRNEY